MGVSNAFTSTYHPQTNGQTERFNRTLTAMLRCYVDDNPQDWDRYAPALTYAYNTAVHRSTGTTPFDLVLSRPPPSFTNNIITGSSERSYMTFAQRLRDSIDRARSHMIRRKLGTNGTSIDVYVA